MLDSRTADVLKQAVGAAQAGEVERARQLAEGALATGGDGVALGEPDRGIGIGDMPHTRATARNHRQIQNLRPPPPFVRLRHLAWLVALISLGDDHSSTSAMTKKKRERKSDVLQD